MILIPNVSWAYDLTAVVHYCCRNVAECSIEKVHNACHNPSLNPNTMVQTVNPSIKFMRFLYKNWLKMTYYICSLLINSALNLQTAQTSPTAPVEF